ncbi:MAG: hypothetical protein E7551_10605 [Ruminococcaceae bacterium]|nr:hypothetical protein [Oscillospiraceae bacterium]
MRITNIDLQCEDIMWFAIDKNGYILEFTSSGIGNVPEFVCADRKVNELLEDFFMNVLPESTSEQLIIPYEDNDLVNDAIMLSQKGIYCFDANGDSYYKICSPKASLRIDNLPEDIRNILSKRYIDTDVFSTDIVNVEHAY